MRDFMADLQGVWAMVAEGGRNAKGGEVGDGKCA